MANYSIAQLDALNPVICPCGFARRAFGLPENPAASLHLVDIQADSHLHYHQKTTEIYVVIEGVGWVELDREKLPVQPLAAILIRPGCRHRAVGKLKLINIVLPAFDPADEWLD